MIKFWVKFYAAGNPDGMPEGWPARMIQAAAGARSDDPEWAGWTLLDEAQIEAIRAPLRAAATTALAVRKAAEDAARQPIPVSSFDAAQGRLVLQNGATLRLLVSDGRLILERVPP